MAVSVAELHASLRMETAQFTKPLADAQKQVTEFRKEVAGGPAVNEAWSKSVRGQTDSLAALRKEMAEATAGLRGQLATVESSAAGATSALGALRGMGAGLLLTLGLLAGGVTLLAAGVSTVTAAMTEQLQRGRELHAVTGLNVQQAVALGNTFQALGLEGGALSAAMGRVRQDIDSGGKSMRALDLTIRDTSGQLKVEGQAFLEIHAQIQQYSTATERARAVTDFFGTELGRRLAPMFDLSRERLAAHLKEMGLLAPQTDKNRRATEDYIKATTRLGVAWEELKTRYGPPILDTLTAIINKLVGVTKGSDDAAEALRRLPTQTEPDDPRIRALIAQARATGYAPRRSVPVEAPEDVFVPDQSGGLGTSDIGRDRAATVLLLTKAEVEQQKALLKEVEAARLRSIDLVQAHALAAFKLAESSETDAAQQSIRVAQDRFAARAAAIDGEIAAIRRTSSTEIREGTEAGDRIRVLLSQRADAHGQMAVAVIGLEAAIKKATLEQQREIAAGEIQRLAARQQSTASLLAIQQKSAADIIAVQGGEEAAFRARLNTETQAAIEAAESRVKTEADYAAAVEATMRAHFAKLGEFARTVADRDMSALPERLGEYSDAVELVSEATESDVRPMEKAWEDLRLQLVDVERGSEALGGRFDATSVKIQVQEQRVRLLAAQYGPLSEQTRAALAELDRLADQKYRESLSAIAVEAQLLGPRFDGASATITAMENRLRQMAETSRGEVRPEMQELAAQLEGFYRFRDQREMFRDLFGSAIGGINKFIEGLQLGTRTWKDFGDMALGVLRSITAEIVNRLLTRALNPLIDSLATAAAVAVSGNPAAAGQTITLPDGSTVPAGLVSEPSGFSVPSIPTGILDTGTLSSLWSGTQSAWGAFNASLQAGGGILDAFGGAFDSFMASFGGAASGVSVALAGVGAALAVFGTVMDFVNGNIEAAVGGVIGGTVGAVAGGIIGSVALAGPWGTALGALAGGAIGDWLGSMIGGLFGGPSAFDIKRMKAAQEANEALGRVGGTYQAAAMSGDIAQVLAALQTGGGGAAGNSVRTELVLPSSLASQIGITGQQIGDQIVAQWSNLTLEQFERVLTAMRENPDLIQLVRGSGDVPYLEGGDAAAIADQVRQAAIALLTSFTSLEEIRDKIRDLATKLGEAAQKVLPPEVAEAAAQRFNDVRDRMLAVLSSGIPAEEMQAQLQALEKELQSYVGLMALRATVEQDIAKLSGDFATQTRGAILGITTALDAANQAVEDARSRAGKAISPEEMLAANAALRDAILGRYALEVRLVQEIQAAIAALLENVGKPLVAQRTTAGLIMAERGDTAIWDALYAELVVMAQTADTAAERLFAVNAGLSAVTAAAELVVVNLLRASGTIAPMGSVTSPNTINLGDAGEAVRTIYAQAMPFLQEMTTMITEALAAGDIAGALSLAQQQAQQFVATAQAAIQAVQQIAQAQISAAQAAAADRITALEEERDLALENIDLEIKGIEERTAAFVKGKEAEIRSIEKTTAAQVKANSERIEQLNAEAEGVAASLSTAQAWVSAAASAKDFLAGLMLGEGSPLDQAAKIEFAESAYQAALAGARATPEGVGQFQGAAQTLLGVMQNDPATVKRIIADLQGVQAAAEERGAAAAPLEARLIELRDEVKQLEKSNTVLQETSQERIAQLREAIDQANERARTDVTRLREDAEKLRKDYEARITSVRDELKKEIERIRLEAQAQIDAINEGLATTLRDNAKLQQALLGQSLEQQQALLDEITDGEPVQFFIARKQAEAAADLAKIRADIEEFLRGIPPNEAGDWNSSGGLRILHRGEMVVPADAAAELRRGGGTSLAAIIAPSEERLRAIEQSIREVGTNLLAALRSLTRATGTDTDALRTTVREGFDRLDTSLTASRAVDRAATQTGLAAAISQMGGGYAWTPPGGIPHYMPGADTFGGGGGFGPTGMPTMSQGGRDLPGYNNTAADMYNAALLGLDPAVVFSDLDALRAAQKGHEPQVDIGSRHPTFHTGTEFHPGGLSELERGEIVVDPSTSALMRAGYALVPPGTFAHSGESGEGRVLAPRARSRRRRDSGGPVPVTIPEIRVPVRLDGGVLTEVVVKNLTVQGEAGRPRIPARAVAGRPNR